MHGGVIQWISGFVRESAMILKTKRLVPLSLFASLLTFAASGDDVNLYRIAFPNAFAQSPIGSFPLDDENTDFIQVSTATRLLNHDLSQTIPICGAAAEVSQRPNDLAAFFVAVASKQPYLFHDSAITPLRC
jgi:hypothetical protein